MGLSISGTTLTFNDATTMTTAATATSTAFDGIGTYAILMIATENNLATGSTIAGSSLRYNYTANSSNAAQDSSTWGFVYATNTTYNGGGSSASGTWRRMNSARVFFQFTNCCGTIRAYGTALYVRIS